MTMDECVRPGYASWDWDFRPLAEGKPAVGRLPGRPGPPPSQAVKVEAYERLAGESLTDQAFLSEVRRGVQDDADEKLERGMLLCMPHGGAMQFVAQAEEKFEKEIANCWMKRFAFLPGMPIRVGPYTVVDESERAGKPKFRLVNDLSWPHPGMVAGCTSENDASDRSRWPTPVMPRPRQTLDGVGILRSCDPTLVVITVADVRAYYRQFARRVDQVLRQVVVLPDGSFGVAERCLFGSAKVAVLLGVRGADVHAWLIRRRLREFDARHPPRDARVVLWCVKRKEAARAAGVAEEDLCPERDRQWACLHFVSFFVDDLTLASINDLLFTSDGEMVLEPDGTQLARGQAHARLAVAVLQELGLESEADKYQGRRRPGWQSRPVSRCQTLER